MSSPINPTTGKILALKSGNICAFKGCKKKLSVDGNNINGSVIIGEMAHIAGEKPKAARYDQTMTDEQRNGLDNLIYMCPSCHTEIDKPGNTYSVSILKEWKHDHETRIDEATMRSIPDVTFSELETVCKAIADGLNIPFDGNFQVTDPAEKMKRNAMTAKSRAMLTMGLGASREVSQFIQSISMITPQFEGRLRAGFQTQYDAFWQSGLRGDELFEELCLFASRYSVVYSVKAASLAVVAYLFEACDVFQR